MADPLTLMAVHAHPDDESSSTGGVLARYSDEGIRTVVVTCTNGELGDGPEGVKPGEAGHDDLEVARVRLAELDEACAILGVHHSELLGYRDSGMHGWDGNGRPDAFCNISLVESGARLAEIIDRYRPSIIITYAANGGYGHPDHVQTHRATLAAVEQTGWPDKLYYTARPRSAWLRMRQMLEERGIELPPPPPRPPGVEGMPGTPDELITTTIDTTAVVERKLAALTAHRSQTERSPNMRFPDVFREVFGVETFVLAHDRSASAVPEDDLFASLRQR
ncbi:MAG TPA: PIG-L family deacetylase [Acidimicrobiales bacterium]|nr:PIG-L family deacetylase [Acidimicrobiales bacterium]